MVLLPRRLSPKELALLKHLKQFGPSTAVYGLECGEAVLDCLAAVERGNLSRQADRVQIRAREALSKLNTLGLVSISYVRTHQRYGTDGGPPRCNEYKITSRGERVLENGHDTY